MARKRKSPQFEVPLDKQELPDGLPIAEQTRLFFYGLADECKRLYEDTKNPLHVWHVIQMWFAYPAGPNNTKGPSLIQSGLQLPEWVHDYLINLASSLLDKSKTEKEGINCLPGLLGFQTAKSSGGGDSLFTQYHNSQKRYYVVSHLKNLLEIEPDLSIEDACQRTVDRLTDLDIDALTLKKWYDRSNKSGNPF